MVTERLKMGLPLFAWVKKIVNGVKKQCFSNEENIVDAPVIRNGQASGTWKNPSVLISLNKVQL